MSSQERSCWAMARVAFPVCRPCCAREPARACARWQRQANPSLRMRDEQGRRHVGQRHVGQWHVGQWHVGMRIASAAGSLPSRRHSQAAGFARYRLGSMLFCAALALVWRANSPNRATAVASAPGRSGRRCEVRADISGLATRLSQFARRLLSSAAPSDQRRRVPRCQTFPGCQRPRLWPCGPFAVGRPLEP